MAILSPLAIPVEPLRTFRIKDGKKFTWRKQTRKWFGGLIHTTGSGVAKAAIKWTELKKSKPKALAKLLSPGPVWTVEDVLVAVYFNTSMNCAHYSIAYDGTIYQCVS